MQNKPKKQSSCHTDDMRVDGFFQDIANAMNRITGEKPGPNQNGQGLPKPAPEQDKQKGGK